MIRSSLLVCAFALTAFAPVVSGCAVETQDGGDGEETGMSEDELKNATITCTAKGANDIGLVRPLTLKNVYIVKRNDGKVKLMLRTKAEREKATTEKWADYDTVAVNRKGASSLYVRFEDEEDHYILTANRGAGSAGVYEGKFYNNEQGEILWSVPVTCK